jgi:NAD(P) transhydrogenase subunit beta
MLANPENVPVFLGLVAISNILRSCLAVLPSAVAICPWWCRANSYSGIRGECSWVHLMNNMLIIVNCIEY